MAVLASALLERSCCRPPALTRNGQERKDTDTRDTARERPSRGEQKKQCEGKRCTFRVIMPFNSSSNESPTFRLLRQPTEDWKNFYIELAFHSTLRQQPPKIQQNQEPTGLVPAPQAGGATILRRTGCRGTAYSIPHPSSLESLKNSFEATPHCVAMASSTVPIGIPSVHPPLMPQTSLYEYPDYSPFSDSDQFSHLEYGPYPQTPTSMPSSYHNMYPYGGGTSNGSPPTYGPPSPKAFKRSMSMSGVGPNLDFGNTSPPTSTSGSNVNAPSAGGDRAFRQILSAIARIQTNLSQQHFSIMDVSEKQGLIQDKLSLLEQQSGRVNEEVTRVLENTDCLVDDVKDVKDRVDSQQPSDDSIRDTLDDQAERIEKLLEDVKAIKLSVETLQASSIANTRGISAPRDDDDERDDDEDRNEGGSSLPFVEIKTFMTTEIKDIVKAQVRSELKALKSSLTSEMKDLKKLYKSRRSESNPRSPGFSPEALVEFEDSEVTKYLLKYGFDSAWKRMLAGYLGQSYRDALTKPQRDPKDDVSDNGSEDDDDDGSGSESDASS
ncbi:hypothetical protein Dda_7630 [Drechslerella dactyloides]|uniref:Uncharacterized protein n=1 Tax=Drechslerella dactyloides TaxID=74499 RepID=A0AAD6IT16_DREDA|nr:hypothetical protein Dda_7630 [Drechslerella dactyloides]